MKILVTGGAASGKSAYAEMLALSLPGPHWYLAAMKPLGSDAQARIERHRRQRAGTGFATVECSCGLARTNWAVAADAPRGMRGTALLECLGNVVANELFGESGRRTSDRAALAATLDGIGLMSELFDNVVVVGNEVGADGVRYGAGTEAYIRVLGAAACAMAARCDAVVEVVAGVAQAVKGDAFLPAIPNGASAAAQTAAQTEEREVLP